MEVSIIIVNYKNPPLIVQCVKSILQFEKTVEYEIIVVDNDSQDDTEMQLRAIYPKLKWVQMGYNSGFAKANNVGIKQAKGEYLFFLNADTVFIEPVLEKMKLAFSINENIGIVGCQLLNNDRTLQSSYHNGDLIYKKLWRRNPILIKFFKTTEKNIVDQNQIVKNHKKDHYCRWLCGAALMMKKNVSEQFLWSEKYFMYWEDVELCYRVRRNDLKILYVQSPSLIHLGGGGTNVSYERFDMMEKSKLLFIEDVYGYIYKRLYILLYKLTLYFEKYLDRRKKQFNELLDKELAFYGIK